MPEGPFGGPRPFASDEKNVLVLVGIDGPEPPNDVLIATQETIQTKINQAYDLPAGTHTVDLTTNDYLTDDQKEAVGSRALHVQQFDVKTPWEEITQEQINAVHNEVVDELNSLGYNITGTRTTVV